MPVRSRFKDNFLTGTRPGRTGHLGSGQWSAPKPVPKLGTHQPGWLNHARVPLFVCDTRLRVYKTLPRAAAPWALDSGGFMTLKKHGRWSVTPAEYVARVRRYRDDVGRLTWAAPQDWMCEPQIICGGRVGPDHYVGTHLSVQEHQRRTIANYLELRAMAPDLPFIPVLQGYTLPEYQRCADGYAAAGVDLTREPLVGLGSVCFPGSWRCCERSCWRGVGVVLRPRTRRHLSPSTQAVNCDRV